MPEHKKPKRLEELALEKAANIIINVCKILHTNCQNEVTNSKILEIAKTKIRPYWISIPGHLRENILELCWRKVLEKEGGGRLSVYLLGILVSRDVRRLKVNLCCYLGCYNQSMSFQLLREQGGGLVRLDLARPTLLRIDGELLESTLKTMSNLEYLIMNNIATDEVLRIVGTSCSKLRYLDVEHSKEVTDRGIINLLLKPNFPQKQEQRKFHVIFRLIKKLKQTIRSAVLSEDAQIFHPLKGLAGMKANEIITNRLQVLKIANTRITLVGVLYALMLVPKLRSLGKYCHTDRALLMAHKINDRLVLESVRVAGSTKPSQAAVKLLARSFPNLEHLVLSEPRCTPDVLSHLNNLKSLHVFSAPNSPLWIRGLKTYLKNLGESLRELTLRFTVGDYSPAVLDLSLIVDHCPNLHSLTQDGGILEWNRQTTKSLIHLEKIQLGKIVSRLVLVNVLHHVPNLKQLHVFSCDTLYADDLAGLTHSKLQCLFIAEIKKASTCEDFATKLLSAPHLSTVGNLSQWKSSSTEQKFKKISSNNNFNISFTYADHWFCSTCFPLM